MDQATQQKIIQQATKEYQQQSMAKLIAEVTKKDRKKKLDSTESSFFYYLRGAVAKLLTIPKRFFK